jgi:hypothetical protein
MSIVTFFGVKGYFLKNNAIDCAYCAKIAVPSNPNYKIFSKS